MSLGDMHKTYRSYNRSFVVNKELTKIDKSLRELLKSECNAKWNQTLGGWVVPQTKETALINIGFKRTEKELNKKKVKVAIDKSNGKLIGAFELDDENTPIEQDDIHYTEVTIVY